MNMASISIFIFISVLAGAAYSGFVTVQCKTETVGQYGQQTMVDCVIQPSSEVADAEIRVVNWKKEGDDEPLLYFNRGEYHVREKRYSFAEPSWNKKNMNVSLLIDNAAVKDEGQYTCTVVTNSGHGSSTINLNIRAKYSRPTVTSTPEKITGNTDAILTCTSEDGYPRGELRWFDEHGMEWTKSAEMDVRPKGDRFHLSSNLTLLQASIFSKYTCVVFNSSGGKEEEFLFEINMHERQGQDKDKQTTSASKIVAPVVVIGSLIVGLLILLVLRLRRNRQARRQSTIPLMDDSVPTQEPYPPSVEEDRPEPDVESGDSKA